MIASESLLVCVIGRAEPARRWERSAHKKTESDPHFWRQGDGMMDVVFYVCIVTCGAEGARVWEVVFRHADVVCLCLVCILWQFSMLYSARLSVC